MTDRILPRHISRDPSGSLRHYAQDYLLNVSDGRDISMDDIVCLTVNDADNDNTVTYLPPEDAKVLARGLLRIAEAVEERANKLEVGDSVETVEQLRALPVGTTIFSGSGRPWYKAGLDRWSGPDGRAFNSNVAIALTPITVGRLGDGN